MKQLNKLLSAFSTKTLMLLSFFALLPITASAQCPDDNHPHMIDLGLPSGTKWACCNVGAEKPEDYGGYFAWGETEEKSTYNWTTYIHCDGSMQSCHYLGADIAGTNYDVAHVTWGSSWVMPNQEQINELVDNCQNEIAIENGILGRKFTGPNGRTIFLPAAGENWNGELSYIGKKGHYYSSNSEAINCANLLSFYVDNNRVVGDDEGYRAVGWSVRPVAVPSILSDNIDFADPAVKSICVQNWDTNGDGELSYDEAAAVTELGTVFNDNQEITSFNELQYFTSLKEISNNAFSTCYNLNAVTIPQSVTHIGNHAFRYCNNLKSIIIPKSVTSIGLQSFDHCISLTSIRIPNSVTSLYDNPFEFCRVLTSIEVEEGNPVFDSREGCNAIIRTEDNTLVTGCLGTVIPNNVTSIGRAAFSGCQNLGSITIPNNVTAIDEWAFSHCYALKSVSISNNVETIGWEAFATCKSLTSIILPKSVIAIGRDAFYGCDNLKKIVSLIEDPFEIDEGTFTLISGAFTTATLSVPVGCKSKYEATPAWNKFQNIVETGVITHQCPDDNHPHMIDLGLPSGTKWACCNVGASKPEDYGGYFAWGETEEKETYTSENYLGGKGESYYIGKNIAGTQYDAATSNWGSPWVMPSLEQMNELVNNCSSEWTTENGVNGRRFTGPNGTSIFLPAAGVRENGDLDLDYLGWGYYWSSSLSKSDSFQDRAGSLYFASDGGNTYDYGPRNGGQSVRPVVAGSSTPSGIAIDETNFPDENFRNWVLAQDYGEDGVLTEEEIATVKIIHVGSKNISDLTGIEHFTALTYLFCIANQLTTLDVSQNKALTDLNCQENPLTSLDLSKNTALESLSFSEVLLSSIDLSHNTALTDLSFRNTPLTSIDLSNNRALTTLSCINNDQLTSLDVTKNTALTTLTCMSNDQLTSIDVTKNTALTRLYCDRNQLTSLDVSKNVALESLNCYSNQLTSLDVSKNTALTALNCGANPMTTIDVSKNVALNNLSCSDNQLTSLDVSKNIALTNLYCDNNQLSSLDISKNTALIVLSCDGNQLTSLDVSKNSALIQFNCHDNQLTSLDLSQNVSLQVLTCYYNQLRGTAMDALIESLPESEGYFYAFVPFDSKEQNVVTKAQVAAAKEKRWTTFYYDDSYGWKEYEGSEQGMEPIGNGETIDIGNEIDENTNLEGTVVDNVFVNISNGDGGFDPVEGCLIVSKPTDDSAINGKDIFGDDFKDNYTGIVFKVNEGKGSIKVEAETQGNMVLKVKIGNSEPIEMELDGKLKVKFPYNVSEPTYVYIYGGMGAASAKAMGANRAKSAADLLKIYGFEIVSDPSGIDAIENGQQQDAPVYNLNGQRVNTLGKGIYIKNGRKVLMK